MIKDHTEEEALILSVKPERGDLFKHLSRVLGKHLIPLFHYTIFVPILAILNIKYLYFSWSYNYLFTIQTYSICWPLAGELPLITSKIKLLTEIFDFV